MWKLLGKIFGWVISSKGIQKDRDIYYAIKEDQELAPKSKKCAVRSILFSVLTFVSIAVAAVAIYLLWKYAMFNPIMVLVFTILILIAVLYVIIACYVRAIINLIHQFRLNRKAHTWIAFVLAILPTILFVLAVSILATSQFG